MKKAVLILGLILIAFVGMIGNRYNEWVSHSQSPFDEVGIGLHGYMPGFVKDWGCGKLYARFGDKTLPPFGCQDPTTPQKWKQPG